MQVKIMPDSFVDRGIFDAGNIEVVDSSWTTFDYGGNAPMQTCLKGTVKVDSGEQHEIYWSIGGGTERFIPSPDGRFLETTNPDATEDDAKLTSKTNFYFFYNSLIGLGAPKDIFFGPDGAKGLIGLKGRMESKPVPRGLKASDGKEQGGKVHVMATIDALPGEAPVKGRTQARAAGTTTTTATANTTPASTPAPAASSEDQLAELAAFIMGLVAEKPMPITAVKAKCLAPTALTLTPAAGRMKLLENLGNEEFLATYGIKKAGSNLTLG